MSEVWHFFFFRASLSQSLLIYYYTTSGASLNVQCTGNDLECLAVQDQMKSWPLCERLKINVAL